MNNVVVKKDTLEKAVNFMPDDEKFCLIIASYFINLYAFGRNVVIYEENLENFTEDKKIYSFYFSKKKFLKLLGKAGNFVILKAKGNDLLIKSYNEGSAKSE